MERMLEYDDIFIEEEDKKKIKFDFLSIYLEFRNKKKYIIEGYCPEHIPLSRESFS